MILTLTLTFAGIFFATWIACDVILRYMIRRRQRNAQRQQIDASLAEIRAGLKRVDATIEDGLELPEFLKRKAA